LYSFDNEASLRELAQELTAFGHHCFLFLADKHLQAKDKTIRFASFHVSAGGKLFPVQVQKAEQDQVSLFVLPGEDAVVFAAAVAVILQKLAEKGIRLDVMHLFTAKDLCTALVCRQYYNLPFIYSVRSFVDLKQKKDDFLCLGLKLPPDSFLSGEYLYTEQLAAASAQYVVDETAEAKLWPVFFSALAGRYVAGKPYVQAKFWAKAKEQTRLEYKKELLQRESPREMVVITAKKEPVVLSATPDRQIVIIPEAKTLEERQQQYRAADFYWPDDKTSGQQLLTAMAAGCLPLIPDKGPLAVFMRSEERLKKACLFYAQGEWETAFLVAQKEFREKPKSLLFKRQQLVQAVHELYSLKAAAALYDKIYRGFAPVHLPFLLENGQIPAVTGRWEER